ncbi:ROK family protein, partial [Nonomuraea longispora]
MDAGVEVVDGEAAHDAPSLCMGGEDLKGFLQQDEGMECVVAVDLGGTTMKGGLVARDGTCLHIERRPTPRTEGPERVVAAVSALVSDLARPRPGVRPLAVGLAVPGLVTAEQAVFSAAFGWRDVPASSFT